MKSLFFSFKNTGERESGEQIKASHFYKQQKKNKLSRYITKAIVTLNKDLKSLRKKPHQEEMRYKLTEDGEIIANDFFCVQFFLCPHNAVDIIFIGINSRTNILYIKH